MSWFRRRREQPVPNVSGWQVVVELADSKTFTLQGDVHPLDSAEEIVRCVAAMVDGLQSAGFPTSVEFTRTEVVSRVVSRGDR